MDNHVLVWEGDLRIRRIEDLKPELVRAFAAAQNLTIDVQSVTGVDLLQLQLICAGNIAAEDMNKKLMLLGLRSERLHRALKEAGAPLLHCCQNICQVNCCWSPRVKLGDMN